ncbi:hypothetical protein BJY59DRAFT_651556 [Rhodotorula toruloides]
MADVASWRGKSQVHRGAALDQVSLALEKFERLPGVSRVEDFAHERVLISSPSTAHSTSWRRSCTSHARSQYPIRHSKTDMRRATLSIDHLTPPRDGERRPELLIRDQSQERMLGIPILFRNEFLAAIKLINCTLVGVSMCNVDMQFDGSRGNPTGFSDETHSRAWKVIQQVYATMKAKTAEADRAWTALLYNWEVRCEVWLSCGRREADSFVLSHRFCRPPPIHYVASPASPLTPSSPPYRSPSQAGHPTSPTSPTSSSVTEDSTASSLSSCATRWSAVRPFSHFSS